MKVEKFDCMKFNSLFNFYKNVCVVFYTEKKNEIDVVSYRLQSIQI